ncbi:MAG: hypothetical protein KDE27_07635 [Planctomycetes bacterium]|nr:hypothetical protein [Planctomycetota bacterium]
MKTSRILLLLPLLLLTACGGGELVGVHIALADNGTGTVTARALVEPESNRAEAAIQGVGWTPNGRAALLASQGTFQQLSDVVIGGSGGLRFSPTLGGEQPSVRVYVPRGPNVDWLRALVPDRATRVRLAKVYDPSGKTREAGELIRIELEVPGDVVASAVHPTGRGVEADRERKRAFLLLPARTIAEGGEELVWDITWR